MSSEYHFLPWTRRGAAASITLADPLDDTLAPRVALPVRFAVNEQRNLGVDLTMYGAGDVTGIDARQIVRTDPAPNTADFEPNYFPMIEFDRADFPWLFTPAAADAQGRLRPWLVLVVVREQPGVEIIFRRSVSLPVLSLAPSIDIRRELPDLRESWAWSHSQVVTVEDAPTIEPHLDDDSVQAVSRLVCPRRLEPQQRYHACLVPAFEVGRTTGLGLEFPNEPATLAPAWDLANPPGGLQLPLYHHWRFGTGSEGDFESLAERLVGRDVPDGVGTLAVDVVDVGLGLPAVDTLELQGALIPPGGAAPDPHDDGVRQGLRALLNVPASLASEPEGPVLAPPIYGTHQAAVSRVSADDGWLNELNLDLRSRAAAGLGATAIRDKQEQLMAAAWDQLVVEPERAQRSRFGATLLSRVYDRRFATQTPAQLVLLTAPSHARVRSAPESTTTVRAVLNESLPTALTSTAFRKVARPNRHITGTVNRVMTRAAFSNLLVTAGDFVLVSTQPAPRPASDTIGNTVLEKRMQRLTTLVKVAGLGGNPAAAAKRSQTLRLHQATDELRNYFEDAIDRPPSKTRPRPNFYKLIQVPIQFVSGPGVTSVTMVAGLATSSPLASAATATAGASIMARERAVTVGAVGGAAGGAITFLPGGSPGSFTFNGVLASPVGTPVSPAAAPAPAPPVDGELEIPITGPTFRNPMYEALRDQSAEYLLPGADQIPRNTVTLLATNRRFIESFMVGLNHEMSRELLWREFPSNQRHTSFRNFWQPVTASAAEAGQIDAIDRWESTARLGANSAGDGEQLVLLIRGDLLLRYPNTFIYAAEAESRTKIGSERKLPVFIGRIDPDMVFVGFDISVEEARGASGGAGWFFVLEQPAGEARFGLDDPLEFGRPPNDIGSDLAWSDVVADEAALADLVHVPLAGRLDGQMIGPGRWAHNGAHQAALTLQRPFSFAVHADEMLAEVQ